MRKSLLRRLARLEAHVEKAKQITTPSTLSVVFVKPGGVVTDSVAITLPAAPPPLKRSRRRR